MYRYLALIWNSADPAATTTAKRIADQLQTTTRLWKRVFDESGLTGFHSGAGPGTGSCETRVLDRGAGMVCGRLFRRGSELQKHEFSSNLEPDESARFVSSRGRTLIDECWGRYVAMLRDASSGEVCVLRDPSAGLPCFIIRFEDVHIVFSDMEDCLALGLLRFSINWRFIAAYVPYSALQIRETGLNEVTEVQAGERVLFGRAGIERQLLWNPVEATSRGLIENPDDAAEMLHQTVRTCVHAWASLHRSIIHNLSGGLDSSIVLSCLTDAPADPTVTCLHYFGPASHEDERKYARLAAGHLNAKLVECALDASTLKLERLLEIRCTPRPWFYIYDLEHGPLERQVAASHGATGIFSGAGGDGLFVQARSDLAVADYLSRHGLRPALFRVAVNAARITRRSVWPILHRGLRAHRKRPMRNDLASMEEVRTVIPAHVLEAAQDNSALIHPWLQEVGSIPPGFRWHILCLSIPPAFYGCFDSESEVERTVVLLSQPLVELCLRIPSYVWIFGGRDRAIARRAFAKELPAAIIRRSQKGGIDRHDRRLIDENEVFMREMLLGGLLVQRGLLDPARLELYMTRCSSPTGFEYNEVLRQHLCTEVWLRRWSALTRSFSR